MNSKMDSDRAKLFVGGISRDTTEDVLKFHFAKYGVVLDSTISVDRTTRCPRGFGFVTFSDLSAADKALQDTHVILGRTVEVKKAIPRSEQQQHHNQLQIRGGANYSSSNDCSSDNIVRTKKIFVGGLPAGISEEEFKNYFERFGRITDVVVMQDSVTHRPRGFGFITFDSEESVQNVMVKSFHDLNGRQVEVKRAIPKEGNHGGYDGFSKLRNTGERGAPKGFPPYSHRNMLPGYAPLPWYSGDGVYGYGSNTYGCWYPMGGYGENGYAVPSDASRNYWYGPMITGPQACHVPYASAVPNVAFVGGRIGIVGNGPGSLGYSGILGSATNWKFDQPFNANGFVPGNVTSPHGVKQDVVDSASFKGSNGEISS
ncbi:RNA-binding protein 1 [Cajanus cajan]|nr:RNA-binding protein 1 [Cajanus cajan]